jgi:plasmid stabilization system protein ParE
MSRRVVMLPQAVQDLDEQAAYIARRNTKAARLGSRQASPVA